MKVEWVQVAKRDSAFAYAIFESLEGWVSFSTARPEIFPKAKLPVFSAEDCYLILRVPTSMAPEMDQVLYDLAKVIGMRRVFSEI